MSVWTNTITNKGLEMLNGAMTGGTIRITKAVGGSASVALTELMQQTTMAGQEQTLSIQPVRTGDDGSIEIPVVLTNLEITEAYNLSQIGLFANHTEEGEILFALAQIDEKKKVPTNAESPGYTIEFYFKFKLTNATNITIETPGPYATLETVERMIGEITAQDVGARPDTWMPTAKDVGALSSKGGTITGPLTIEDSDGVGLVKRRVINGIPYKALFNFRRLSNEPCPTIELTDDEDNEIRKIVLSPLATGGPYFKENDQVYHFYGEHNKPTGAYYRGTGDATKRTIDIGGIGELLWIKSANALTFVWDFGGVTIDKSAKAITYHKMSELCFEYGVLTIATTSEAVNSASNVHYYGYVG